MKNIRKCNGCNITTYDLNKDFTCCKCGFKYINSVNVETELKIKFYEDLSESSIKLIQRILEESLDYKTDIERLN